MKMNKIVSINKNNTKNFSKKAEDLMIEEMTFIEKKRFYAIKDAIENLDKKKLKDSIVGGNFVYKTTFLDKEVEIFNPVDKLIEKLDANNSDIIIDMLVELDKENNEYILVNKNTLKKKNTQKKLGTDFLTQVVKKDKIDLFQTLIHDINEVSVFKKNSHTMLNLLKSKIKRDQEKEIREEKELKRKNRLRPVK